MEKLRIGVVGCGRISPQYLDNLVRRFPFCLEVHACADLVREAAETRAREYNIPRVLSVEALLADDEIEAVVNLTVPAAHYDVTKAALEAGKHVYQEKPLAVTREEGAALVELARQKNLRLGGAPDTFLGAGLQTCRKLIDEGWIGRPLSAQGFIAMGVHVARYHTRGIGPMFDMGPYYVTAMVTLLGPVTRVTGAVHTPFPEKFNPDPLAEDFEIPFPAENPTVVSGVFNFAGGVIGTLTTTCEIFGYHPRLEIYGTEGILTCNDPNMFGGPVLLRRRNGETREMPLTHNYDHRNRGLGVADMAYAIRHNRPHRAGAELMYHVHEIMHAIHEASHQGQHITIASQIERPAPFPAGLGLNIFR